MICSAAIAQEAVKVVVEISQERLIADRSPVLESRSTNVVLFEPHGSNWCISAQSAPERWARTFDGYVIDRPAYDGQQPWLFVSSLPNGYPIDLDEDQRLLWLAYCGIRGLVGSPGHAMPLPAGDSRRDPWVYCAVVNAEGSHTPEGNDVLSFRYDAGGLLNATSQLTVEYDRSYLEEREKAVRLIAGTHRNGEVIADFKVNKWLTSAGCNVPGDWEFSLRLFESTELRVRGKTLTCQMVDAEGRYAIPSGTQIVDKRFRDPLKRVNAISYISTNGNLLGPQDSLAVNLQAKAKLPIPRNIPKPKARSEVRVVQGLLLAIVVLAPLVFIIRPLIYKTTKPKQSSK